jgi:L-serine dehydratase
MRAAALFAQELAQLGLIAPGIRVRVDLYGSLALTGRGHGTDRAVLLGLEGHRPDAIDPADAQGRVADIRAERALRLNGGERVAFDPEADIQWHMREVLPGHSNGLRCTALAGSDVLLMRTYYSVGGGFVETEGHSSGERRHDGVHVPRPFDSAAQLLELSHELGRSIADIVLENEDALRPRVETIAYADRILEAMDACALRGLETEGTLPGGLNVRRRAPRLYRKYREKSGDPLAMMDYVNAVAMAVNEENAAGGRVVTAPTNGAAGVIPAVLHYYRAFCAGSTHAGERTFLLTASAIGALYKANASISGAEVGCQGEVGVACSMAAGGLVAALGGSSDQVENAAEIGMEHSLGMTCDPIGGLVQVPCIERNAVGAVRAIHAARMAMEDAGDHVVSLDRVIDVMYRTGLDMQAAYKETSLGGLAVSVVEC